MDPIHQALMQIRARKAIHDQFNPPEPTGEPVLERPSWRARAATILVELAERLEPEVHTLRRSHG